MTYLVTGGAGFIGSNFLQKHSPTHPNDRFINVDALTYAGNLGSLRAIEALPNYTFERADICSFEAMDSLFQVFQPDVVVHFAAESHVDRSILGPRAFVETNVVGTLNLLEAARKHTVRRFHHVSTDEVYGSLGDGGKFLETTNYDPSSPYSASKAGSDHLVRSYGRTFGLSVSITNCSNNYGARQFPEKLIPLITLNALEGKPLPVYGTGGNVRDWLFVEDHCDAIWSVIHKGREGETYNVGGDSERTNLQVISAVLDSVAQLAGKDRDALEGLITYVQDRPGHDWRYAIDASKIQNELGWAPSQTFETGIHATVKWYLENMDWVDSVRSGEYRLWIEANYGDRA